nr:hypothetical protein [Tanacetum cinerariifolium]
MLCLSPKSTGFNEFSSNIATALVCLATNRVYNFSKMIFDDEPASPIRDDSQGEAFPTDSGLEADQDRENILKTSMLPRDSTPRVTSLAVDEGSQVKLLEDREGGGIAQSGDDAPIKGRSLDEGTEATERVNDDTEEMATVLTSMDATSILTSGGVQVVPIVAEVATATIARDVEIARIHAEKVLQMLIDGLNRNNETVTKKQQKEFYILVLKSHAGWKERHFKGMTLEEIKEKFDLVWKQFQDFIPIGSKEEPERFKRKGVRLEQYSFKKLKTSEEVPKEKLKEMMELTPFEEVYVEALQVKHPIIDWEVHTKGQRSYWKIIRLGVKETLNIRLASSNKEMELWIELKRLYEPDVEEQLWTHTQNMIHAPVEWNLDEFPLPEKLPTAYEDKFPLLIQSDATAERIALLLKTGDSHGQRHSYDIQRRVTVTQLFKESVP